MSGLAFWVSGIVLLVFGLEIRVSGLVFWACGQTDGRTGGQTDGRTGGSWILDAIP